MDNVLTTKPHLKSYNYLRVHCEHSFENNLGIIANDTGWSTNFSSELPLIFHIFWTESIIYKIKKDIKKKQVFLLKI